MPAPWQRHTYNFYLISIPHLLAHLDSFQLGENDFRRRTCDLDLRTLGLTWPTHADMQSFTYQPGSARAVMHI